MDLYFVENGLDMPPVGFDYLRFGIQHNGLHIQLGLNRDKTVQGSISVADTMVIKNHSAGAKIYVSSKTSTFTTPSVLHKNSNTYVQTAFA